MRALFLAKYLDSGGVTTHMHTLARKLRERGVDVAVASGGQVGNHTHGPEWFEAFDIPHFTVPFTGRERDLSKLLRSLAMFPRVIRNVAPDIIHVHWRAVSLFAHIEMVFHGIPFVTTLHMDRIPNKGLERRLSFWGAYGLTP